MMHRKSSILCFFSSIKGVKMRSLSLFESNSQSFIIDDHISFNFNYHTNLRFTTFSILTETKSYTPITGCVLEHILTTTNLTNNEKLYYLIADSLALIGKHKGYGRSCALPSEDWAKYLACSRSLVFTMQKSLEQKGYFIINKDFDNIGRNKRNLIIPTLPSLVFNHLNEKFPDRVGVHLPYNPLSECKRSYLDRTKLFIKLNYNLLRIIAASSLLNYKQKVLWLSFYNRCYKNYILQGQGDLNTDKYSYNDDTSFSFISTYKEIAEQHSCNTKHLSKSLRNMEELVFIKTQNIYVRKRSGDNAGCKIQERQDKSLWKITLSLPKDCILELEKVKDRANLITSDIKVTSSTEAFSLNPIKNCLILGGIKFNLNHEQSSFFKSLIAGDSNENGSNVNYNGNVAPISSIPHTPSNKSYTDSITEELSMNDGGDGEDKLAEFSKVNDSKFLPDVPETVPSSSFPETISKKDDKNDGIKSDPTFSKSGLLLNIDFLLKLNDIKSNLRQSSKVLFNDFLKRFKVKDSDKSISNKENDFRKDREFNIHSELIREKLKILPKEKANKARRFAYALASKDLACGYAASLNKHELVKQIIYHIATWKPTKLGSISKDKEIDTALSVAWKKIVKGTWQIPLELAKAEVLQHEFMWYKRKYQESGVLSCEVNVLEVDTEKLLGKWCDLRSKIRGSKPCEFDSSIEPSGKSYQPYTYLPTKGDYNSVKHIINANHISSLNAVSNKGLQGSNRHFHFDHQPNNQFNSSMGEQECAREAFKLDYYNDSFNSEFSREEDDVPIDNIMYSVDLSKLTEVQKHMALRGSDTEIMEITTSGNRQYFGQLKTMEVNNRGELVMTLAPGIEKQFIESENRTLLTSGINVSNTGFGEWLPHNTGKTTGSCKNGIGQMQEKSHGLTDIDKALAETLNYLSCNKDE